MDYDELKGEIKQIAEIASSVPEQFRDKCFELLMNKLLGGQRGDKAHLEETLLKPPPEKLAVPEEQSGSEVGGTVPLKTQVRLLMRRTGMTLEELEKILLYEDGEAHFIKEPHDVAVAVGQIEWALLLALKNAILSDSLSTDPEEVRSICQEKGYYDGPNFATIFKRPNNAKLFKNALVPQGVSQPLTLEGQDALGKLVKRLASETQ